MEVKDLPLNSCGNELELNNAELCGCYYCCQVFKSSSITEWVDEISIPRTALCPLCGIDSVVANVTNVAFLKWANSYWFSTTKL